MCVCVVCVCVVCVCVCVCVCELDGCKKKVVYVCDEPQCTVSLGADGSTQVGSD